MKSNRPRRLLIFEQLELKAAPSSMLLVVSEAGSDTGASETASNYIATQASFATSCQHQTDQILRFIEENATGGERTDRSSALPTVGQCAAADEMMSLVAFGAHSLLVLGFYHGGTEL